MTKKILYTILTCSKTQLNADACTNTWTQDINTPHDWFFYGDKNQSKNYHKYWDCTPLDGDTYENLAKKTLLMLQTSLQYDWDFLYKCDDDTYVVPSRLEKLLANRDPAQPCFIGCVKDNVGFEYAQGGAGYIISRSALITAIESITHACEADWRKGMGEDTCISKALTQSNIQLEPCELLSCGLWIPRPKRKNNPQWLIDAQEYGLQEIKSGNISTHHINHQSMIEIHKHVKIETI